MGQGISKYQSPFANKASEYQGRAAQAFASMQKREKTTTKGKSKGGGGIGGVLGAAAGIGGAVLGSMVSPGLGTMIGGALGGMIGNFFGGGGVTGMTPNNTPYTGGNAPAGSKYFDSEKGGGTFATNIGTYFA